MTGRRGLLPIADEESSVLVAKALEDDELYIAKSLERMANSNPDVARCIESFAESLIAKSLGRPAAAAYAGAIVYNILECTESLPRINRDAVLAFRNRLDSDKKYAWNTLNRLLEDNPVVGNWLANYSVSMGKDAGSAVYAGTFVYGLLEMQAEINLRRRLKIAIKDEKYEEAERLTRMIDRLDK